MLRSSNFFFQARALAGSARSSATGQCLEPGNPLAPISTASIPSAEILSSISSREKLSNAESKTPIGMVRRRLGRSRVRVRRQREILRASQCLRAPPREPSPSGFRWSREISSGSPSLCLFSLPFRYPPAAWWQVYVRICRVLHRNPASAGKEQLTLSTAGRAPCQESIIPPTTFGGLINLGRGNSCATRTESRPRGKH